MEGTLHNHPDRVFSFHFPPNNKYVFCLAQILIKTLDLSLLNLYSSCLEIHCYETDPSQTVSHLLKVKSDTFALVLGFTCRKGQKYLLKVIESCFNKKKSCRASSTVDNAHNNCQHQLTTLSSRQGVQLPFSPNNKYVFCLSQTLIKTLNKSLLNLYYSCLEMYCYETDLSQIVSHHLNVKSDTIALVLGFTCRNGQKYLSKVIESCFNKKNHVERAALLTTRTIIASTS